MHIPQSVQSSESTLTTLSTNFIASTGHSSTQLSQPVHFSSSIFAAIFITTPFVNGIFFIHYFFASTLDRHCRGCKISRFSLAFSHKVSLAIVLQLCKTGTAYKLQQEVLFSFGQSLQFNPFANRAHKTLVRKSTFEFFNSFAAGTMSQTNVLHIILSECLNCTLYSFDRSI